MQVCCNVHISKMAEANTVSTKYYGPPAKSIDDIFGKPKKSISMKQRTVSSSQPTVLTSEKNQRKAHSFKKSFSIEDSVSSLSHQSSLNNDNQVNSLSQPQTTQRTSVSALPKLSRIPSRRNQPRDVPRYLMPRAEPKIDCEVMTRARNLIIAADEIQHKLLNPDSDPVYRRNEHRLRTKARARNRRAEESRAILQSVTAKEMRADRVAHDRQFEKQLKKDIGTYRNDIKRASVAVQRTLVSDPILLRHQKEMKKKQRNNTSTNRSNSPQRQEASLINDSVGTPFSTGAHSKEGDAAIRRAKELTAMALAQL